MSVASNAAAPSGSRPTAVAVHKDESPQHRRDVARLGMWVFLASELLFFGGLLVAYFYGRLHWPAGFAAASRHTDVLLGTVNTALLLTSSAFAAVAVAACETQRWRWVRRCLMATAALGLAFLAIKGFEWHAEWTEGLFPGPGFRLGADVAPPQGAELFFMLYFVMTGLHALHMLIGVGVVGVMAHRALHPPAVEGEVDPDDADEVTSAETGAELRIEMTALYWHFVDIVWVVLYPLLYLVERHS
ncbi:MAG: hypothetical protein JWP52_3278 [Rhizobacter sp.]|nr:hypothetical protein [Rhizobacter sp.]